MMMPKVEEGEQLPALLWGWQRDLPIGLMAAKGPPKIIEDSF